MSSEDKPTLGQRIALVCLVAVLSILSAFSSKRINKEWLK